MKELFDYNGKILTLGDRVRVKCRFDQKLSFNCIVAADTTGWLLKDCETGELFRPDGYVIYYGHHVPYVSVNEMRIEHGLTTRAYHSLLQGKIYTLQDIVDSGVDYIWKLPRIGTDSMNNINEVCCKFGVKLLNE